MRGEPERICGRRKLPGCSSSAVWFFVLILAGIANRQPQVEHGTVKLQDYLRVRNAMQQAVFIGFPTRIEYFRFRRCSGPGALLRQVFLGKAILCDDFHTGTSFRQNLLFANTSGQTGYSATKWRKRTGPECASRSSGCCVQAGQFRMMRERGRRSLRITRGYVSPPRAAVLLGRMPEF